jgi:hypothetical protein
LDLLDLWRGKLSPRKASVLAVGLPAGAVVWQVAGVDSAWTTTDHLLARAIDALEVANWMRSEDGSKGKNRPEPVLRPTQQREAQERQDRILAKARAFRERQGRTVE